MMVKAIIWFGKYDVIKKLADGGSSSVYLVKHRELESLRVMKRLPKSHQSREQFLNEINILKSQKNSAVPVIYDVEEDTEFYYIIEEYIEGESLRAYRLGQKDISEGRIIDFAIQICEVIKTLHSEKESILYCDLKPENIIVYQNRLKLVDFGASMLQEGNEKRKWSFGTKGYAAPEQFGFGRLDKSSDIFGIGGVLFFLVTGRDYQGKKDDWIQLEQKRMYSKSLKKMIQKCLRHYPVERYKTVEQLQDSLGKLQKNQRKKGEASPYMIAVTGNEERVGTTHISFMLTKGLNQCYGKALYVESGEKQVISKVRRELGNIENCPMVRGEPEEIRKKYPDFQYYVCDYGTTDYEKSLYSRTRVYESCNKYLVVTGLKPWEKKPDKLEGLEGIEEDKILFLANFADGNLFLEKSSRLNKWGKWVRVPYVPNPFQVKAVWIKELIDEILYEKGQNIKK